MPWRPVQPLPEARLLGETSLMLLVHPTLSDLEIQKTVSTLAAVLEEARAVG
jgi:dTDP-4-amino-4,6-dideoxygalactose transaminase